LNGKLSSLRVFPDIGNLLIHKYWSEIVGWLARGNA